MRQIICFLLLAFLSLSACAPKVIDREFPQPKTSFGPRSSDKDLSLRLRESGEAPPELFWEGEVSTSEYLEQAENLVRLGELTQDPVLRNKGLQWIKKFYTQDNAQLFSPMEETPFTALVGSQTQEEVSAALINVLEEIEKARPVIREHILALGNGTPTLTSEEDLETVLVLAEAFTQSLIDDLPSMNLAPVIEEGLRTEIRAQTENLFSEARAMMALVPTAQTLTQVLNLVDDAIVKFEVEKPDDLVKSLAQGRKIAQSLDVMKDAQGGLRVLIDVWETLTPAEREEHFKPVNETLYDFLSKQDAKELLCLRTEGCRGGLFKGIAKKVFILPKLKEYGLDKLKNEMNGKTREFVLKTINEFGQEFLRTMPETFAQQIDDGIVNKAQRIRAVKDDYISYIKRIFKTWSLKMIPEQEGLVAGFETAKVHVNASRKSAFKVEAMSPSLEVEATTISAGLSANALLLENMASDDPAGFSLALSQINKLVAIAGYRNTLNQLVPPLLSPVAHEGRLLDIMNFESTKGAEFSFRIPDRINLQDAHHADTQKTYDRDFSAAALISQLRGFTSMLRFTADWKISNFDHYLTPIKAQEVTQDAEDEALNRSLFPKDMLFALNLGTSAVLLQDLTKQATSLFLLTLDNKVIWGDSYSSDMTDTVVMAGIVDIKNGARGSISKSADVANLLKVIAEFLEATDGVENTKSPILLEADTEGERPLDTLIQGRKDLKLLSIALANFISNELLTKENLVRPSYELALKKKQSTAFTYSVKDQLYSIRALLKASELTGIDAYKWAAQDIFFAMNKKFFNNKEEFYRHLDGTPLSFPDKLLTLVTLSELAPHLEVQSQDQLRRLGNPWLQALRILQ